MTDLEMMNRCAEAMGIELVRDKRTGELDRMAGRIYYINPNGHPRPYDPLEDDAQAMALLKRFKDSTEGAHIDGMPDGEETGWTVCIGGHCVSEEPDLSRAIVSCCARMQAEKGREK